MITKEFSSSWKASTQPRKQRKYRYGAPLHVLQTLFHVHLSLELRQKYGLRSILVRKGDKVRVMRGQFSKKEGKVERVLLKHGVVHVQGMEIIKKDGSKILSPLQPSNLLLIEVQTDDAVRKAKLESKSKGGQKDSFAPTHGKAVKGTAKRSLK
jgi:large subunit ribosomal protein L24